MRRITYLLPAILLVFGTVALGDILNSKHDLRPSSTGPQSGNTIGGLTEICLPCHTPHNSDTSVTEAPLWNHQLTTQSFQMYTTLQGRTGDPDGASKLCLSCHDGVTAMDNYGGNTSGSQNMTDAGGFGVVVGTDLQNDHPIGLSYPPPDSTNYETAANVKAAGLRLPVNGSEERVECQSCHDPHTTTNGFFLRIDNTVDSDLCRVCHTL